MACKDCRRNKFNSGSRNKSKTIVNEITTQDNLSITSVDLFNRKKKCSRCPFTTSPGVTGRCKKANRMISKAIIDPTFKCPIKRFKSVLSI